MILSQIQAYILVSFKGHYYIHQEAFIIFVNNLTNKTDIYTREKFWWRLVELSSILLIEMLKNNIFYDLKNRQSRKKFTILNI